MFIASRYDENLLQEWKIYLYLGGGSVVGRVVRKKFSLTSRPPTLSISRPRARRLASEATPTMSEFFWRSSDADSDDGSEGSLDTLPGAEEFLHEARKELKLERAARSSPLPGVAASAIGASGDSTLPPVPVDSSDDDVLDAASAGDDDGRASAADDDRSASIPSVSARQASLEDRVESAVLDQLMADAIEEFIVPRATVDALERNLEDRVGADDPRGAASPSDPLPPMRPPTTKILHPVASPSPPPRSPSPSPSPSSPPAIAVHEARLALSNALHAIADDLVSKRYDGGDVEEDIPLPAAAAAEDDVRKEAVGVTGAIVKTWRACEEASTLIMSVMTAEENKREGSVGRASSASPWSVRTRSPTTKAEARLALEDSVFAEWTETGLNADVLVTDDDRALPSASEWPL